VTRCGYAARARQTASIGRPKNGRERKIVLLPPARVLDQVPRREDGFIFHTARGEPLQKGNHRYAWRAVRAASGIAQERPDNGQPDIRWCGAGGIRNRSGAP
jgi:integrase